MKLYLVRHGATDMSDAARFNGHRDVPLNDAGLRQARALAEALEGRSFACVWSSDLTRALQTAQECGFDPVADPRLRELDFGDIEGATWEELDSEVRDALMSFEGFAAPGGESVDHLRRRVLDFIEDLAEGEHLVFTHGGVIRALLRDVGDDRDVRPGQMVELESSAASRRDT
jgi:probable phosphoglycerate mutase